MKTRSELRLLPVICALGIFAVALMPDAVAAQNLAVNGDFESGNAGFTSQYSFGDVSGPGTYNVGPNPSSTPGAYSHWCNCSDHTTGTGMMMIVNGANSASWPVWEEVVHVVPSTEYKFSYWGAQVDHSSGSLPPVLLKINGRAIGCSYFLQNSPDNNGQWQEFSFSWNSGSSHAADLALLDLNTDTGGNDFALDDISFTPAASSRDASPAGRETLASGPIITRAQVTVKDSNGNTIELKPAEKVAVMFVQAISFMENDCMNGLKRRCSLAELVAGVNSPSWPVGRLKYDPARDPNYKYTITISGKMWTANAVPQHPGLGGFYVEEGASQIMADTYYNRNGAATDNDIALTSIGVGGEQFQVR
jgi:hypothetical protein